MSGFFWNICGFYKKGKQEVVSDWLRAGNFNFGCLIETKITERRADRIMTSVFKDWSVMTNYEDHRLGRLWLVWRGNVRVTPIYKTSQMITCSIYLEGRKDEFFISFIYASNFVVERKVLWNDLKHHHDAPMFQGKPWLICGDFNEILDGEEHSLYVNSPTIPHGMRDFLSLVTHCELTDLSYQGPKFTWCNKRHDGVICKKLDLVLVNKEWLQTYDQSYSVFEPGGCSDHMRCRFYIKEEAKKIKKPFKFTNSLTTCSGYQEEVGEFWKKSPSLYHSTSAMHMLSKKLKELKPHLRRMGKRVYGDITIRTKEAFKHLCDRQAATMLNLTSQVVDEEAEAYEKWQRLSNIEEGYLQQKAKLHWMKAGDQNNKAFYNAMKVRENRIKISEIQCLDGTNVSGHDGIKNEAERYFKEFLKIKPADYEEWSPNQIGELLQFQCDEGDKLLLTREVTTEEIRKTLFSMPVNKSPGRMVSRVNSLRKLGQQWAVTS